MNDIEKMARRMNRCDLIPEKTCKDCLSESRKLFGNKENCALIEYATALTNAGYRKQSDTVKEFAKAIARIFEGITQRFCDCYNDGLHREYPDSELSRNFFKSF